MSRVLNLSYRRQLDAGFSSWRPLINPRRLKWESWCMKWHWSRFVLSSSILSLKSSFYYYSILIYQIYHPLLPMRSAITVIDDIVIPSDITGSISDLCCIVSMNFHPLKLQWRSPQTSLCRHYVKPSGWLLNSFTSNIIIWTVTLDCN